MLAVLLTATLAPLPASAVAPATTPADATDGTHRSVPLAEASAGAATRSLPGTDSAGRMGAASSAPTRTATITLDEGVHVVGLRWEGPQSEAAELRLREPGASWGAWTELDDAVPTAPSSDRTTTADPAGTDVTGASGAPVTDADEAARATSGDVVVGPADVQVRLVGEASAATLEAWSTQRTDADAAAVRALPVVAQDVVIGTRADWGADESLRRTNPRSLVHATPKLGVTVHHTAGINNYAPEDVPSIIRGIFYYHGQTLGWGDIGYATLIDKYGRAWEGRAGGVEENVQLAHAFGMNRDWTGITVLGNHETAPVSSAELTALSELTAWTLDTHGVSAGTTVRYQNAYEGWTRTLPVVHAHRDVGLTLCPGYSMYALMDRLRTTVAADQREGSDAVQRIGGRDRYGVAANVAQRAFLEGTRTAYLASGSDRALADALAVGPVAAQQGAALLLTRKDALPQDTITALTTLGVREVRIVGGTISVTPTVENDLKRRGFTVTRIEGKNRYEVAARLSADAVSRGLRPRTVYLAGGQVMTDALGGSAAAAHEKATLLLTSRSSLPAATSAQLAAIRPSRVVVLGGPITVQPVVLDELRRLLPGAQVDRVGGKNRYDTSALTATYAFDSARSAVVASGTAYADAISSAQLAARHGSPVILVRRDCRHAAVDTAYTELGTSLSRLAGGPLTLDWSAGHTTC